ncbi:MAG: phenylacetate--CoA ligase, partial [Chloroflexales bacterium]|nr:phenylacetate--CoA ligase [Chloroflexales bacterium]
MLTSSLDTFIDGLSRDGIEQIQIKKLQRMLEPILKGNRFYQRKLGEAGVRSARDIASLADLRKLPFTEKRELVADQAQHPPYGSNLTYSREHYIRVHQTSGTTGQPLYVLDTDESWQWWLKCWAAVYSAVGITAPDRIFFA